MSATISLSQSTVMPLAFKSATTVRAWRRWEISAESMSRFVYGTPSFCISANFFGASFASMWFSVSHWQVGMFEPGLVERGSIKCV